MFEFASLNAFMRSERSHSIKWQQSTALYVRSLALYREWNSKITLFVSHFNCHIVTRFFELYILANLPFNSFVIIFLTYSPQVSTELLYVFLAGISAQIGAPLIVSLLLVRVNHKMYCSVPNLIALTIRASFGKRTLHLKEQWKSLTCLEMIHRQNRAPLLLTAGALGAFQRKALIEVI